MDIIKSLSRTEMKSLTAGFGSTNDKCHKCCTADDSECGECKEGVDCPSGYHTHKCAESECETIIVD